MLRNEKCLTALKFSDGNCSLRDLSQLARRYSVIILDKKIGEKGEAQMS